MGDFEERAKEFFRQSFCYIVIALSCVVYVVRGLITMTETGKTVLDALIDGGLALLFGIFLNMIFGLQGILKGKRNQKFISTTTYHGKLVDKVAKKMHKLDGWCEKKNAEALKVGRIRILSRSGLSYKDCFDENGVAKTCPVDFDLISSKERKDRYKKKQELLKLKAYNRACNLKLTQLSSNTLTSEGGRDYDPYYMGRTLVEYQRNSALTDLVSKLVVSIISAVYSVELVTNFNWGLLIWTGIQVVLFLLMGVIKMQQNYLFIVDDYRGRIVKKIDKLTMFDAECCEDGQTVAIEQNQAENVVEIQGIIVEEGEKINEERI